MDGKSQQIGLVLALFGFSACGDDPDSGDGPFLDDSAGVGTDAPDDDDDDAPGDDDDDTPGDDDDDTPGDDDDDTPGDDDDDTPGDDDDDDDDDTGGEGTGFSQDYPGDVGIADHPSVLFFEDFEDGDIATLTEDWDNATLPETLSLSGDVPAGAVAGSQSLTMTNSGGGTTLYNTLPDQDDRVYVRYYARYNENSAYHHTGMWIGGYNPATPWPQGNAGLLPSGADFFHNTFEPAGSNGGLAFDHYAYWPGMGCVNQCWGNNLMSGQQHPIPADTWVCFELMMKVNAPGDSDGEFSIWVDDELVQAVEPGTPFNHNGVGGWSPDPAGEPFPGFNWRSTPEFGINFLWLDFYTDGPSSMDWDQVVVATERVGCMAPA